MNTAQEDLSLLYEAPSEQDQLLWAKRVALEQTFGISECDDWCPPWKTESY